MTITKSSQGSTTGIYHIASLVAQTVKRLPATWETWVWSLGWEDPLEKEMATHSSILAWRTPRMEEPGGLQSTGSQRVRHNWATSLLLFNLLSLLQQITHSCIICSSVSPQGALKPVPSCPTHEAPGHIPGEDWQIDFTHVPPKWKLKLMLTLVDTFSGWIEAFPMRSETASEVTQFLIGEIIPHVGLPLSLQSDNGPAFISQTLNR